MSNGTWLALMACGMAACGGVSSVDDPGTWTVDRTTTDGALLGVWGSGPTDVWAVGGKVDHALVLHGDGVAWTRIDVPFTSQLVSVYGFSDSDVYAVGEHGLIIHYDGTAWTRVSSGTDLTLFGSWGASGDDVWIVGGDLVGPAGSAIVLRGSHGSFAPVQLPAEMTPSALFKVHGFAADDVMIVGSGDAVLRWNGTAWRDDPVPTTQPLFSTWGRGADDVYAVGGRTAGEIVHFDGSVWSTVIELATGWGLRGVFTSADGPTIAVGPESMVFELGRDGSRVQAKLPVFDALPSLHAVWGDGAGTTYTVGGDLDQYPGSTTGVILSRR